MTERIAYESDGKVIDADVARWVMAVVEVLESEHPGFRARVLEWIEASEARSQPADPAKIAVIQGMIGVKG